MTWSKAITQWQRETFGEATPERALERVEEEYLELYPGRIERDFSAAQILAFVRHQCGEEQAHRGAAEESADVVITLAAFVATLGFDLAEEVEKKMAKNRARKWRVDGTGCGYHVKDES